MRWCIEVKWVQYNYTYNRLWCAGWPALRGSGWQARLRRRICANKKRYHCRPEVKMDLMQQRDWNLHSSASAADGDMKWKACDSWNISLLLQIVMFVLPLFWFLTPQNIKLLLWILSYKQCENPDWSRVPDGCLCFLDPLKRGVYNKHECVCVDVMDLRKSAVQSRIYLLHLFWH